MTCALSEDQSHASPPACAKAAAPAGADRASSSKAASKAGDDRSKVSSGAGKAAAEREEREREAKRKDKKSRSDFGDETDSREASIDLDAMTAPRVSTVTAADARHAERVRSHRWIREPVRAALTLARTSTRLAASLCAWIVELALSQMQVDRAARAVVTFQRQRMPATPLRHILFSRIIIRFEFRVSCFGYNLIKMFDCPWCWVNYN